MAIDEEETIEQATAARRERLKALKAAQQLLENPEDDGAPASDTPDGENGADDDDNDTLKMAAVDIPWTCKWSPTDAQMKVEMSNHRFLSHSSSSLAAGDDMDTTMNENDAVDDHDNDHNQSSSSGMTESSNGSMMNGSSSSSPSFGGLKNPKTETLFGDEGSKITVKATYKEDTVRFKFEPSSGWFQLYEEVAKRFKIQTGTFQLKYRDDEEEWVVLVCESDWNECLEILDFLGTRTVKFLVRDATFAMGSSGSSNCFLMGGS